MFRFCRTSAARLGFLGPAGVFLESLQTGIARQVQQEVGHLLRALVGKGPPVSLRDRHHHTLVLAEDFVAQVVVRNVALDFVGPMHAAPRRLDGRVDVVAGSATQKPNRAALG